MKIRSVRHAAVLAGSLVIIAAGSAVLCRAAQGRLPAAKAQAVNTLSSKTIIPNYRLNNGTSVKAAAAPKISLRNDGTPGKARQDFLLRKDAYALALVPTYDGSNQETHPKLLYFANGWNGYRYWMSMTPYPGTADRYENPSIVVSNDLKTWLVPKGLENPVTGIPDDVKHGGHYSDSHLVMNGNEMELWYRVNKADKKHYGANYVEDYYYRMTSTDGIHWSKAQLMQASNQSILSLAVLRENNRYQFWYTNRQKDLMYAESENGTNWDIIRQCEIPLPKGYVPWHQDVVFCNNKYYLLQTALYKPSYSFALFLSESADGIHFTRGTSFYPSDNQTVLHKTWLYRSTFVPVGKQFQMMVSYRLPGNKWFMTECSLSQAAWDQACLTNKQVILKGTKAKDLSLSQSSGKSGASAGKKSGTRSKSTGSASSAVHSKPKTGTSSSKVSKAAAGSSSASSRKASSAALRMESAQEPALSRAS